MRLNKFFALNTHYNRQEDEDDALAGSGGSSSGGGTRAPLTLSVGQLQAQIDLLNAELRRKYPDLDPNGSEIARLQEQAYAEFLQEVQTNPALSVSEDVFATALTIPVDQARSQYYNFDFTGKERLGLESRTPVIIDQIGSYNKGSVFTDPSDRTFLPPMLTQEDVQAATQFDTLNPSYAARLSDYLPPEEQRLTSVAQDSPAFTTADSLPSTLFDSINFPAQEITRGTPVVTRGLTADGSPTTAITMGQSTAAPSGPDIGELTTYAQFPSTGMGINPDGTGTTTVGTQGTTGNIVATGADNLTMFDTPLVSQVDPNVLNIGTGLGGTNTTASDRVVAEEMPVGLPPFVPQPRTTIPTPEVVPLSIEQQVANIVRESEGMLGADFTPMQKQQALDAGKAKIAELGMNTAGGISAEQIAAGAQLSGANRLLDLDTEANTGFVRNVIDTDYLPETTFSAETPFMQEDETVFTFKDGGAVQDTREAALDSRFMSRAGLGSLQGKTMSPAIAGTLDRIMARRK